MVKKTQSIGVKIPLSFSLFTSWLVPPIYMTWHMTHDSVDSPGGGQGEASTARHQLTAPDQGLTSLDMARVASLKLGGLNHPNFLASMVTIVGESRPLDTWQCHSYGWQWGLLNTNQYDVIYGRNQSGCEKAKKKWDFHPLYFGFSWPFTFFALMTITMCFNHLEASHIMSCNSWY